MPLRVVLVALLLAGLGLWQSWQCTDDMALLLMPAAMAADSGHDRHPTDAEHGQQPTDDHGSLAVACMSVLAAIAGALLLLAEPSRLLTLLRRAGQVLVHPVGPLPRAATLAQLCILRT
ncbi:hypothetical protein GCM10009661_62690 [Catellatospora chokoriensis]|uniref:Uncharacterized protein n=2 Tax=Catellatospora chokoriensis TaxID=310353 RepID=A0A8J3NRV9_9ACTN|nr:hypothetical protein Cch02nite_38140 [Catellatospora chokoriensis]